MFIWQDWLIYLLVFNIYLSSIWQENIWKYQDQYQHVTTSCYKSKFAADDISEWTWMCSNFLIVYLFCIANGDPIIKWGRGELFGLTLPHCCACLKVGTCFLPIYHSLFVISDLRWEVVVHFIDVGGNAEVDKLFIHFLIWSYD